MTGTVQSCYNLKNLVGPCDHAMTGTVKIVRWLKGYCRSVRSCDDWNRAILWWLGPCKAFGDLKDLVGPCDLVMTGILTVCAILQWLGPCESCNDLYSDWFVRLLQTRWCVLFRENISSDWFFRLLQTHWCVLFRDNLVFRVPLRVRLQTTTVPF